MFLTAFTLWFALKSHADELTLESLRLLNTKDGTKVELKFNGDVEPPTAEFINETVQVDIPQAHVKNGHILQKVGHDQIKSLYAYQVDDSTARFRVILNSGQKADNFKDIIRIEKSGAGLSVWLSKPKLPPHSPSSAFAAMKPHDFAEAEKAAEVLSETAKDDSNLENDLKNWNAQHGVLPSKQAALAPVAEKPSVEVQKEKSESETPVFISHDEKKVGTSHSSSARVIASLVILALMMGGAWWSITRWMHKKNLKNPHTSIRVITQHYLGPKKSLAIVSVAGESILIGITDQNISMIKTLALLDEDLPRHLENDFKNSLKSAEQMEVDDAVEDYAVKGVRDIVADKVKGMRNLW